MELKTGRFGAVQIQDSEIIHFPQGLLGFPDRKKFCLIDPNDDTLILWLQSVDQPDLAFAVLEPKVFRTDYTVRLSAAEMRELKLEQVAHSAVYSILTIPADVSGMTANLKAPLVINLRAQLAKQVVLQENEYGLKQPMFKELRAHLVTLQSAQRAMAESERVRAMGALPVRDIPSSLAVKSLGTL